ncbi:protease inhibitor I42 family protein [Bacteroidota bacterium]
MKALFIQFLTLVLIISSCEKVNKSNSDNTTLDYEISINDTFHIDLISNPSTGYSWAWTNKQLVSIVDTIDHSFVPDTPILVGSGGKEIWKFTGIKSGIDSIKLEYCRLWESNSTTDSKIIIVKVN